MLFSDITLIDEDFAAREHQWIGTIDGRIAYVGSTAPEDPARFGEAYDGRERVLIPGMYNAHSHAPMTLLRGYAENLPLQTWLFEQIFPFEAKMTPEDCYWATKLACAEMLRYGTVSFSDMYYHVEECVRAVREAGMKCNLSDTLIAPDEKPYEEYPLAKANRDAISGLQGADDGRVMVDFNVHAEYTTNPVSVRTLAEAAKEAGVRMQVHVSETRSEHEECKERHNGMTPVQYFDSLGLFDVPTTAAHCTWIEGEDFDILAERGVTVATNPVSNMKLASGFAPVPRMLERGINVALGTDGCASNNNLDMFQDLYVLALICKGAAGDPTLVSPAQALRIATRNGALSQGRDDCGLVREGMRADLVVLDASGPSWHPAGDAASHVVYAGHGADVVLTMVDGQVLYRDGSWPTLDVEEAKARVEAAKARIVSEL